MFKTEIKNEADTKKLAEKLAEAAMGATAQEGAAVLALVGDLGAGKTTLTKYFLEQLGVKGPVQSPTFILMKNYPLEDKPFRRVVHVDCYRLEKPKEALLALDFDKLLADKENIVVVEWAEKIKDMLPKDAVWVELEHKGGQARGATIKA